MTSTHFPFPHQPFYGIVYWILKNEFSIFYQWYLSLIPFLLSRPMKLIEHYNSKISTTGFRFPVLPVKSSYSSFFWWGNLLVPFLRCQSTLRWTRWPFWAAVVNSRPCLFEAHIIPLTFDHLHLDPTILLTSQIRLLKTQITLLKLHICLKP